MIPGHSDIMDLVKKGATLEVQEKILELREAALRAQEENLELKTKLAHLEEMLLLKNKAIWKKPSYWLDNDGVMDGPFCQKCYDSLQKLIRLQDGKNDCWNCRECKSHYTGPNYVEPRFERGRDAFY
ncbi:MAG: hypothetical protein VR73_06185 [Gammaproteobacteria bacterium BRH_c0]|nr:MAG: hypothetical protein VR73_06185 [Gammaproteobacteria bacterium BRH_c0]